jgi:hypothetical protein
MAIWVFLLCMTVQAAGQNVTSVTAPISTPVAVLIPIVIIVSGILAFMLYYIVCQKRQAHVIPDPEIREDHEQIQLDEYLRICLAQEDSRIPERFDYPGNSECAICLDPLESEHLELARLSCNHSYHKQCIFEWYENNFKCPLCCRYVRVPIILEGHVPESDIVTQTEYMN